MEYQKKAQKVEEIQEANTIGIYNSIKQELGIKLKELQYDELANNALYKQFSFISNHLLRMITKNEQSYRYKMHFGICKMMEFNELELVYWHLLNLQLEYGRKLQHSNLQEIKSYSFHFFKDFLKIQAEFIPDFAIYKRELLFLILSAFYTIKLLRNIQKLDKIREFIKEDKFCELFNRIEPAFINVSQSLSLYTVNQKYLELTMIQEPLVKQEINYNFIVEQILEMAPAYQKDEEQPISKKVKRQKKLMTKTIETLYRQEQESQQKIEAQQQQQSQQQQFQNQQFSQNEQQYLDQPQCSRQFSRQFNQLQQSQGHQQIQQDYFSQNERFSFQCLDRQNSFGMQLRSNRYFNSQESQFNFTPPKEIFQVRNLKSTQWTSRSGK
ncbi:unnamed protein product [Paramecium sonneborni]|uniref:Uncharacterized protein n=1 Tax=Paramecium sonneborni TaxID=65129 RepID=A0A8S1KJN1_9CILI|nr:unnamed protein product [Paramecium sonneborni]